MSKSVGDYQLTGQIGKGTYADVHRGTHKKTGKKYAIKMISKEILSEPKLLAGLKCEIDIMREFENENIVRLHEYFSSEKNFYLVLELCAGGDLNKFIRRNKRLEEHVAQNFLLQIASGLKFLHERNFIHRDLKPANVLMSENSMSATLKLADFGFARELSVASLAQTRCGTPLYMAPEILESRDYDGKADVWSVGCIFFEMLVGTCPFKGNNEGDLLNNIKTKELSVPADVSVSKSSIEILVKLLERNPLRRAALDQLLSIAVHLNASAATPTHLRKAIPTTPPGTEQRKAIDVTVPSTPPSSHKSSSGETATTSSTYEQSTHSKIELNRISGAVERHSPQAQQHFHMRESQQRHRGGSPSQDAHQRLAAYDAQGRVSSNQASQRNLGVNRASSSRVSGYSTNGSPSMGVYGHQTPPQRSMSSSSMMTNSTAGSGWNGVVGNLIAYVFNPSAPPTPQTTRSKMTLQQQQQMQRQIPQGRSISLDRGHSDNNFPASDMNIATHFDSNDMDHARALTAAFDDVSHSKDANTNSTSSSDGKAAEDDFVLIDTTAAAKLSAEAAAGQRPHSLNYGHSQRGHARVFATPPTHAVYGNLRGERHGVVDNHHRSVLNQHSQPSNGYNPSDGNFVTAGQAGGAANTMQAVDVSREDAMELEVAASRAFYESILQRCEVYYGVVNVVTELGDCTVREALSMTNKYELRLKSSVALPADSKNSKQSNIVDRYLTASSLYFHALSILSKLMSSFDSDRSLERSDDMRANIGKIRQELSAAFQQLIERAEGCQSHVDRLLKQSPTSSSFQYVIPVPEPIMLHAAAKREEEANFDELLGNLNRSCKLYASAKDLVDGVALTACDPDDQRKLRQYSSTLQEKYTSCRKRANDLLMLDDADSAGGSSLS